MCVCVCVCAYSSPPCGRRRAGAYINAHDTFLFKRAIFEMILRQVQLRGELLQRFSVRANNVQQCQAYPLHPIERTGPCYPPIRSAYYFPYRTRVFFEHDNGDENASKKPPQTVARKCCQLSAATTRTRIGPLKRTCNCYTLLYIVGLSPLEQQS